MTDIAERIRHERDRRDWSQQELATRTGIDRDKIGKIETGDRKVNSTEVVLFADAFEINPQDLLRPSAVVMRRGLDSGEADAVIARFNQYVEHSLLVRGLEASLSGDD